jgi:hypothetical protein
MAFTLHNRWHCRRPEQRRLFQNRQECIDSFAAAFRDYTRAKQSLSSAGLSRSAVRDRAVAVVSALDPRNMAWFAEHFTQQLLVSSKSHSL